MTSIIHVFQVFIHLIALLFVCVYISPVVMSLCDYLSVCLCGFLDKKIDQAGGPETF